MADEATTATEKRSYTLDDLEGRTPEELSDMIDRVKAQIRDLHYTDNGELRQMSEPENKALGILLKVHERAEQMYEEHRKINDVLRRRPKAIEYSRIGKPDDDDASHRVRTLTNREARDRALRALDDRYATAHLRSHEKDEVDRQIRTDHVLARRVLITENEAYRNAWMKMVTRPNGAMYLDEEERDAIRAWDEFRAMSEGTTTAGGFGVPVKLAA